MLYDRTPPPAPSGLSVPPITTTQPTLVWVAGGPDALSGFDHFELLRDGNLVASTAGTSITDVGLTANGSHTYAVRSVDAAGNQSPPTPVQRTIFDNTPPEIPTNVAAASPTNRPNITWTASIDSGGSAGVVYSILRDGNSSPIATTSGTSFLDTSPLTEGAHTYAIVATDAAGNVSAQSLPASVTVDITPPDPVGTPTGATPTVRPVLAWDPASDPSGIARYDVYRGTTLVGSSVTPSFIDSAIATDGSYAYSVVAVDNAGNRALASAPLSIVFDHTPPPAPSIAQGRRRRAASRTSAGRAAALTRSRASTTTSCSATGWPSARRPRRRSSTRPSPRSAPTSTSCAPSTSRATSRPRLRRAP